MIISVSSFTELCAVSLESSTVTKFLVAKTKLESLLPEVWQAARVKAIESLNSDGHVCLLPKIDQTFQYPTVIQDFPESAHKNYVLTMLHGNWLLRSIAMLTPDGGWIVGNTPEAVLTQLFTTLHLNDPDATYSEYHDCINVDTDREFVSVTMEVGKYYEGMPPMTYMFCIEPISCYLDRCKKMRAMPSYVHVFFHDGGSAIQSVEWGIRPQEYLTL